MIGQAVTRLRSVPGIIRQRGFIEFCGMAFGFAVAHTQYALSAIGPIDRVCYRRSIQKLRERQRLESGLIGILSTAYGFRGHGLYKSIAPIQEGQEIAALANVTESTAPKTIVEIGTARGGSLYTWSRYLSSADVIVSVDLSPYHSKRKKFFREFSDSVDFRFVHGNSHKDAVKQEIEDELDEGIDFLFIDGDHSYEGVKTDFEKYYSLVNEGGILAFHDIVKPESSSIGVPKFWREIRDGYQTEEIINPEDKERGGIGIIYK